VLQDAAVVAAVSELQTRKQRLERLEGLQQAFQSNKRSQLQGVVDALRSSSAGGQAPAAPTKKS
jgi:BioD-like phosphotransacetylase family protein